MNTASKLALLCAMALAAMAVASASALATTIAPEGLYRATEDNAVTITNDVIAITCTASRFGGNINNTPTPPTMTITALTLDSCQNVAAACTVTVDTLPAQLLVWWLPGTGTPADNTVVQTQTAVMTLVSSESPTITCGAVQCTASVDTTLEAEGYDSTAASGLGELRINEQPVTLTFACGSSGTWNGRWTIDQTSGQQTGATPATITYTSTSFDVSA